MRWIKKLLRIFAILLPSFTILFLAPPSHALKHDIRTIPLKLQNYHYFYNSNSTTPSWTSLQNGVFSVSWQDSNSAPSYNTLAGILPKGFISTYNSSDNTCRYSSLPYASSNKQFYYLSQTGGSMLLQLTGYYYSSSVIDFSIDNKTCNSALPFGSSGVPQFNDTLNSLTPSDIKDNVYSSLPYTFSYSHFKLRDSKVSGEGITYNNSLMINDLLGAELNSVHSMRIPLGVVDSATQGNYVVGRPVKIFAQFNLKGSTTYSTNATTAYVDLSGVIEDSNGNRTTVTDNKPCSFKTTAVPANNEYVTSVTCDFVLERNYYNNMLGFTLHLHGNPIFSYTDGEMSFSTAYVTTDNDSTPSDAPFGSECIGSACDTAPGSAILPSEGSNGGLNNLFSFSLMNPFSPIFNMFSPNQCVQIPILSGMLGATETQYCSWFPNSVRDIVTPVIGISSVMLLFGFFIRWLGGGSSNIIDPYSSSISDGDNLSLRSKYERRKK